MGQCVFFFQAEDGIRDIGVTGVQTCALPILAMYHDQALIPIKTMAFEQSVNVTLGLPYLRVSVDHGTAFDKIGRASCRERVETSGVAAALQQTTSKKT